MAGAFFLEVWTPKLRFHAFCVLLRLIDQEYHCISMTAARGQKLLDKMGRLLREVNLLDDEGEESAPSTLPEIVGALVATTEPTHYEFNESQCDAWARCSSDLTTDRSLAVEALRLGILPALSRFLQRYKSSPVVMAGDVSW